MTENWISFHLYRAGALDAFLAAVVGPFVTSVLTERLASGFFFIRYWDAGAHIRLRFRTAAAEPLVRRTRAHFESYFAERPSFDATDGECVGVLRDGLHEVTYEPEVARYGGRKAMVVSEKQFEASSRAVLAAMSERAWSYESAIGAAVQLHITFVSAMGLDIVEAGQFFAAVSDGFANTRGWLPPGLTAADAMRRFAALFATHREHLVSLHRHVWSAMKDGARFEQPWANRWMRDSLNVAKRLHRARGLAKGEPWTSAELAIMMSYVHMTNNRLGVMNQDEAYVAYLLMRGFQEAV